MENEHASSFELLFPLPLRILALINLGIWLWYLNISVCHSHNINFFTVLSLPSNDPLIDTINATYKLGLRIGIFSLAAYLVVVSALLNGLADSWLVNILPLLTIIIVFGVLLFPKSANRKRLSQTWRRVVTGRIDSSIRVNDILLADTITSYAKVLVDLYVYVMHLCQGSSIYANPDPRLNRLKYQSYNLDLVFAVFPSLLRLKQCLAEYSRSGRRNKQHLFNALKYSTAFLPVTVLFLQRLEKISPTASFRLWILTSFVNSTFSFFWDVKVDWNLDFFESVVSSSKRKVILRAKLLYNAVKYYYIAIAVDFVLRYLWLIRLLPEYSYLQFLYRTEQGLFVLEILEVLRRWVWIFIKVETEFIKTDYSDIEMHNLPKK